MEYTRIMVENRLYNKQIVSSEYQKIINKMFGSGEGKPRIFNYPIEKTDIEAMVVAAYYLAKFEHTRLLVDQDGDQ